MNKFTYESGDEEDILMYAFRYCLGRQTFCVLTITNTIIKNWDRLSKNSKLIIKREIRQHKEKNGSIGSGSIDEPLWIKILELD